MFLQFLDCGLEVGLLTEVRDREREKSGEKNKGSDVFHCGPTGYAWE